jgi:histidinol-phosphatase (PHP family)
VHSEFSWDTGPDASMWQACERAVELGLPAISFTEHVDFTSWAPGDVPLHDGHRPRAPGWYAPVDVEEYLESVERCRDAFPGLRVRSGIETGEPHLFAGSVAGVLAQGDFDRVLGSLHSVVREGELVGVGKVIRWGEDPYDVVREYFGELLAMVEGSSVFEVLAHCDFPRRYWPRHHRAGYAERDFEDEYRAVFAALAASGRALEVNTTSPLASVELLGWWREAGGERVSFGSDAHVPWRVGQRFADAVAVADAAGFRPGDDPADLYRRA